ncbi:MAG: dihydroorotate dehydrogenase-like protein [Gemmatimonadaceae bacterium]|nr:dihydroorotate dehydrogenase-like protein [Gemmatimonadaceae bacterium]
MTEMTTKWLGLTLTSPIVVGAGPLSHDEEAIASAVDHGAGAVVMYSLFEEQVAHEHLAAHHFVDARADRDAEARQTGSDVDVFAMGADAYLKQLERLRRRVNVPVVASLNGTTPGGWTEYARACSVRGASAIELNLYDVVTATDENSRFVEERQLAIVDDVLRTVDIPVAVKISPFYTSIPAFVRRLEKAGAAGVTLFNRFCQPDIDLDTLTVDRRLTLSHPHELPLRLHALAILSPAISMSLACSGGVHTGRDAAKALLCGADVMQLTSALLQHGPSHVGVVLGELTAWLTASGYASSDDARGALALSTTPDAYLWERVNYIRVLDGWRPRVPRH